MPRSGTPAWKCVPKLALALGYDVEDVLERLDT
jgi:hypothetical protein